MPMEKGDRKYPEGHFVGMWIGIGIAVFAGIGVTVGIATNHAGMMSIFPALGVAIGVAVGSGLEAKYKKAGLIRPLTEKEEKNKKRAVWFGIGFLVLGILIFLLLLMSRTH